MLQSPEWAPDGRHIVFSREGAIWEIDAENPPVDGGAERQLTPVWTVDGLYDTDPAYSPSGDRIAFARQGVFTGGFTGIWLMSAAGELAPSGGPATRLTLFDTTARGPAWLPDASRVVYTSVRSFPLGVRIRSVDPLNPEPGATATLFVPDEHFDVRHVAARPGSPTADVFFRSSYPEFNPGEIVRQRNGEHDILLFEEDVTIHSFFGRQQLSVSADGKLVFTDGDAIWMTDVDVLDGP